MSLTASSWVVNLRLKSGSKKAVLFVLADYVTDRMLSYPQMKTITNATGMSESAVKTALEGLIADKIITDSGQRVGDQKDIPVFKLNPVVEVLEIKKPRQRTKIEASEEALKIYELYPRKVNKRKALSYIERGIKQFGFEIVFNGTNLFAEAFKKSGKEMAFCPHDTTFFFNERYTNEPSAWGFEKTPVLKIGPTILEVRQFVNEKETDPTLRAKWATGFFYEWQKRKWEKHGKPLDWKIELSAQIGRWRTEPK